MFLKIILKPMPLRHSLTFSQKKKKQHSFHGGKFVYKTNSSSKPSYRKLILWNYNKDFDAHCK